MYVCVCVYTYVYMYMYMVWLSVEPFVSRGLGDGA